MFGRENTRYGRVITLFFISETVSEGWRSLTQNRRKLNIFLLHAFFRLYTQAMGLFIRYWLPAFFFRTKSVFWEVS